MNPKQTLFGYVYGTLREQIVTGQLKYGDLLPSMNSLCELYHVGIRTVKDVLHVLKEEGYIRTQERKRAVVVFRFPETKRENSAIQAVLERKSSILAVCRSIAVVMPLLFSFSVQLCGKEKLKYWSLFLARAKKSRNLESRWQACSAFLYDLLENSGNLLFRDIFVSLETYVRILFFKDGSICLNCFLALINLKSLCGQWKPY